MQAIEIIIAPAGGNHHADVFTAHWDDILLATSRTPFFDAARKLLELGADAQDIWPCGTVDPRRSACVPTLGWLPS
jgi:hypothetical protein